MESASARLQGKLCDVCKLLEFCFSLLHFPLSQSLLHPGLRGRPAPLPRHTALRSAFLHRRDFPLVLMEDKSKRGKKKDGPTSAPPHHRKGGLKFKPRVPTKKAPKGVPKMEPGKESEFETIDKDLLIKLRTPQSTRALEGRIRAQNNEACVQVAFGQADHQLQDLFTPLKVLRQVVAWPPLPSVPYLTSSEYLQSNLLFILQVKREKDVHLFSESMLSDVTTSAAKLSKQCAEPQDFTHPDYNYPPLTIPPRRHYSGDPEFFDEDDFSEFSSSGAQDGELTAAQELGLMVCISCHMVSCQGTPFLFRTLTT
uniref:Uncharacterized protein n=1 Tax=Avena sativa TaxID=4498 RepID=A0ACD5ZYD9_AVESA